MIVHVFTALAVIGALTAVVCAVIGVLTDRRNR